MEVGIDIVKIERFKSKTKLAQRILSEEELLLYVEAHNKEQFVSGRFAAKEAFIKARGSEKTRIPFKRIKIIRGEQGKPSLHYENKVYPVSIAHDGEYAVAVVIVKKENY